MINFAELQEMMRRYQRPVSSTEREEPALSKRNPKILKLRKGDKRSLSELKKRLADTKYYSSIVVTTKNNVNNQVINTTRIVGTFDNESLECGDCEKQATVIGKDSDNNPITQQTTYPIIMMTRHREVRPSALTCVNCGTNYMSLIK